MDKKGLVIFLLVTFVLGAAMTAGGMALGFVTSDELGFFRSLYLLAVMWVPAVGALAASLAAPDAAHPFPRIWPLPVGAAARLGGAVLFLFTAAYAADALIAQAPPQWHLSTLMSGLEDVVDMSNYPENVRPLLPGTLLAFGFPATILLGFLFFPLCVLGLELGWRGYLLPRLLPLGRAPAHLLTGALWGLWFLPLPLGYAILDQNYAGLPVTLGCGLAFALGLNAFLGEIFVRRRLLGLSTLAFGLVVSQQQGMWPFLFPASNPPLGGDKGLLLSGMLVLAALAAGPLLGREPTAQAAAQDTPPED